jgi:hypothetical protein
MDDGISDLRALGGQATSTGGFLDFASVVNESAPKKQPQQPPQQQQQLPVTPRSRVSVLSLRQEPGLNQQPSLPRIVAAKDYDTSWGLREHRHSTQHLASAPVIFNAARESANKAKPPRPFTPILLVTDSFDSVCYASDFSCFANVHRNVKGELVTLNQDPARFVLASHVMHEQFFVFQVNTNFPCILGSKAMGPQWLSEIQSIFRMKEKIPFWAVFVLAGRRECVAVAERETAEWTQWADYPAASIAERMSNAISGLSRAWPAYSHGVKVLFLRISTLNT